MILSLFRKPRTGEPVYAAYAAIVAQSRQPVFYADWGVPDTVTGRFDMISLHLVLLFRCLRGRDADRRDFAQDVFDLFFRDMDRQLREMGVTDIGVPKRIQKMGNLFYGLLERVNAALDGGGEPLETVLARNVFADGQGQPAALAAYLVTADAALAAHPLPEILAGRLGFGAAA